MRSKLLKSSKQWRDLKGGGNKKMSETREEEAEDPRDEPAPIRTHSRGIPRPGAQSRSRNALTHWRWRGGVVMSLLGSLWASVEASLASSNIMNGLRRLMLSASWTRVFNYDPRRWPDLMKITLDPYRRLRLTEKRSVFFFFDSISSPSSARVLVHGALSCVSGVPRSPSRFFRLRPSRKPCDHPMRVGRRSWEMAHYITCNRAATTSETRETGRMV